MEKSIRYVSQIKALCSTSHERVRPKSKYTSVSSPQINLNTKQFICLVYQCVKSLVIYLEHFGISNKYFRVQLLLTIIELSQKKKKKTELINQCLDH